MNIDDEDLSPEEDGDIINSGDLEDINYYGRDQMEQELDLQLQNQFLPMSNNSKRQLE